MSPTYRMCSLHHAFSFSSITIFSFFQTFPLNLAEDRGSHPYRGISSKFLRKSEQSLVRTRCSFSSKHHHHHPDRERITMHAAQKVPKERANIFSSLLCLPRALLLPLPCILVITMIKQCNRESYVLTRDDDP